MRDPDSFVLPERGDRAYAALSSVAAAVVADPGGGRWERGWRVFGRAADAAPDVAAIAAARAGPLPPARSAHPGRGQGLRPAAARRRAARVTRGLDAHKLAAARVWAAARMPYLAAAMFASTVRADPGAGTIAVDRSWPVRADPAVSTALEPGAARPAPACTCAATCCATTPGAPSASASRADGTGGHWNRSTDAEINDDLLASACVPDVAPTLPADLGCEHRPARRALLRRGRRRRSARGTAARAPTAARARGSATGRWTRGRPSSCGWPPPPTSSAAQRASRAASPAAGCAGPSPCCRRKVDWRRVLAAEIRRAVTAVAGKVDYSYRRPSRRAHLSPDVVLPTLVRPVPDVAIVCDTSGSMHDRLLARALAEVEGVLSRAGLRQRQVRVLAVDTDVHAARRVSRASQVRLAGGGGTDMGAGIAAAAALRPRPSVVVVLTDGYTPWPERRRAACASSSACWPNPAMPRGWPPPAWARTVVIDDHVHGPSPSMI